MYLEKFEDTKGGIRSRKSKSRGVNSGKVSNSCSTSDTRHVTHVANPEEKVKNGEKTGLWLQEMEPIRGLL